MRIRLFWATLVCAIAYFGVNCEISKAAMFFLAMGVGLFVTVAIVLLLTEDELVDADIRNP